MTITPTQRAILDYAIDNTEGRLEWFPPNLRGGAQAKVLKALQDRQLITFVDPVWYVDTLGYDALGLPRPGSTSVVTLASDSVEAEPHAPTEIALAAESAEPAIPGEPIPTRRTRAHSKQATIIALLKRPEGATLAQITEATQWQIHTTRGFLAGAVKKRLGLNLTSEKPEGGVRIYRIIEEVAS